MNRVGAGLIAGFAILGLAFAVAPVPGEAGWILKSIGLIWLAVAGGLLLFARSQKRKAARADEIFRTGVRARATVLEASTNVTVNEMPVMKLKLELDIPGHGTRTAERRETMPVFAARRMREGLVLPAYVSTTDPEEFILVW